MGEDDGRFTVYVEKVVNEHMRLVPMVVVPASAHDALKARVERLEAWIEAENASRARS